MMRPPADRVEVVVSTRTTLKLLFVGLLVALANFSIATLLSISSRPSSRSGSTRSSARSSAPPGDAAG